MRSFVRQRCWTDAIRCGNSPVFPSFLPSLLFPEVEVSWEQTAGKRGLSPCIQKSLRQEDVGRTRWTSGRRWCISPDDSWGLNSGQCPDSTFGGQSARRRLRPGPHFTDFSRKTFPFCARRQQGVALLACKLCSARHADKFRRHARTRHRWPILPDVPSGFFPARLASKQWHTVFSAGNSEAQDPVVPRDD
jgi:hypothetical protein